MVWKRRDIGDTVEVKTWRPVLGQLPTTIITDKRTLLTFEVVQLASVLSLLLRHSSNRSQGTVLYEIHRRKQTIQRKTKEENRASSQTRCETLNRAI